MKITETMLVKHFDGLSEGLDVISVINGEIIHWSYRRGENGDGYNPKVCSSDEAGEILLEDGRRGMIPLDDPRPDYSRIDAAYNCVLRDEIMSYPHTALDSWLRHISHRGITGAETMKVKPLGPNMTEIIYLGDTILYSYETPVACIRNGLAYRTSKHWSNTTSRHINKWLADSGLKAEERNQEFFDGLLDGTVE